MSKKVSFDFDSTLSIDKIEEFAKELVQRGFEVWIVTTRHTTNFDGGLRDNSDLFETALRCGISFGNIHFTNGKDKWGFLKDKEFIFHIDDDWHELKTIKSNVDGTVPISSFGNPKWKHRCIKALGMKVTDFE